MQVFILSFCSELQSFGSAQVHGVGAGFAGWKRNRGGSSNPPRGFCAISKHIRKGENPFEANRTAVACAAPRRMNHLCGFTGDDLEQGSRRSHRPTNHEASVATVHACPRIFITGALPALAPGPTRDRPRGPDARSSAGPPGRSGSQY